MKKINFRAVSLALACACVSITAACSQNQREEPLQFVSVSENSLYSKENPNGTVSAYYYSTMRQNWISVVKEKDVAGIGNKYTPKGDYYKLYSEKTEMIGLWIKPARELDYYKTMQAKGYTGVAFDYYAKQTRQENTFNPDGTMGPTYNGIDRVCYNGTHTDTPRVEQWTTVTLSLDVIIRDYALLTAGTYTPATDGKTAYEKTLTLTVIDWYADEMEVYVGNFRSVKAE